MRATLAATAAALSLAAAALLFAGDAAAGGGPPGVKASFVKGDVTVGVSADGKAAPTFARLKRNQSVPPGGVVKTGDDARAELSFPDGSVVRVGPQSELKVDGAAFDGKSKEVKVEATLVAGKAWAKVAKLVDDESKFQVKTQNAVAGVRGTVFRVNVDRDEATVVKVYNGAVAVASPFLASSEPAPDNGPLSANRKPIAPPMTEVSKKEFEHLLGKMMQVRVTSAGVAAAVPAAFTEEEDQKAEPEWVRWNAERDAGKDTEKSD